MGTKNGWQVVGNISGKDATAINERTIIEEVTAKLSTTVNSELTRQVTSEEKIRAIVAGEVARAIEALPNPKDGVDGKNGIDGVGLVGPAGPPGPPGIGEKGDRGETGRAPSPEEIGACVEREFSKFALECERRLNELADRELQRAISKFPIPKDGVDGKNGRDAMELDDLDLTIDDDGFIHFTFKRGQLEKSFTKYIPTVSDKGVYKQDKKYLRQNGVTHNGSFWIAQVDHPSERPGTGAQWRLAVKAGVNGRNGNDGKEGPQGPPGQDLRYK